MSFCGLFGGTNKPVFSFSIISGIPPVLDAIIGRPETIASSITIPKASRTDGRMKKSAVFIKYGMFFWWPSRVTVSVSPLFAINFSSTFLCGPSPAIAKWRFFLVFTNDSIALSRT